MVSGAKLEKNIVIANLKGANFQNNLVIREIIRIFARKETKNNKKGLAAHTFQCGAT